MKKLNLILLALSLICGAAFGQVQVDPNFDPRLPDLASSVALETAERDAHEASTTTSVHGLGTMSGKTASDYYTKADSWYVGNTAYSATGEDSVTLPLNAAATSIAFDAETSGYIRAEIVGTNSTDTACIHVTLTAAFEDFGDTLAFVGSPASLTDQLNAATWSASLSASGDDLSVIATGAVGTLWQVKKLEIGGL